ncbi:hypothetical protein [Halorussus sp. AFM4]
MTELDRLADPGDLGADDDEIEAATWFESVPEECEHGDLVARHL